MKRAFEDEEPAITVQPKEIPDRLRHFWRRSRVMNAGLAGLAILILTGGSGYLIYQWGENRGLQRRTEFLERQDEIRKRHALAGELGDLAGVVGQRAGRLSTTADDQITAVVDAVTLFDAPRFLDLQNDPSHMDAPLLGALSDLEKALDRIRDKTDETLRAALERWALPSKWGARTQRAADSGEPPRDRKCDTSSGLEQYDILTEHGVHPPHNLNIYFPDLVWMHGGITKSKPETQPTLLFIFTDDDCKLLQTVDSRWAPPQGGIIQLNSSLTAFALKDNDGALQTYRVSWVPRCDDKGVCAPHAIISQPVHAYPKGYNIDDFADFELIWKHLPDTVSLNTLKDVKWMEWTGHCNTPGGECTRWIDTKRPLAVEITSEKGEGAFVHLIRLFRVRETTDENLPMVKAIIPFGAEIEKIGFDEDDRLVLQTSGRDAKGDSIAYILVWQRDHLLSEACELLMNANKIVSNVMSQDVQKFMKDRLKDLGNPNANPCEVANAALQVGFGAGS